jgi:glyoxylase-like metal-dependent hydrolase (beta-lactamase superfamily II)
MLDPQEHGTVQVQITRREAIGRVAGAGLGLLMLLNPEGSTAGSPAQALGQPTPPPPDPRYPTPSTWETELKEIGPNIYSYIQGGGPGRDNLGRSNAGIIVGENGILVIDSLAAPIHAKNFIAAIRNVSDKPFRHLVYTHHHGDHVGGGQYFAGAEIIGHPYCRQEVVKMAVTAPTLWAKRDGWAEGTELETILPPVTTYDNKVSYYYGKNTIEVFPMAPAHTYGDLVIYMPQHKLLFAGDVGFFNVAPFCQNANPSSWIDICNKINEMDVQMIVPGHGPLGGKAELSDMRDYLVQLKKEARTRYDAKISAGAAAADIRMGKFDNWVGPERIVMDVQRFYLEFSGKLTPNVDAEGIRQATEDYNTARRTIPNGG